MQTAAPASPSKEAIESEPRKVTLTVTPGASAEFSGFQMATKLTGGALTSYECMLDNKILKIEFVGGQAKYTRDSNTLTRRLKNQQPEAVVIERQEGDPGIWVHLVRSDRFKKLKKTENVKVPIYTVNGNTHFEVDIQAAYFGDMQLAGSKGKVKVRRYEIAHAKTRWTIWADEAGDLVAMKTVAWVRGDERYLSTYQSRADLFDTPEVKAAPKD